MKANREIIDKIRKRQLICYGRASKWKILDGPKKIL